MKNITANSDSIFLDANVLLELILDRKSKKTAEEIMRKHYGDINISTLTGHLVIYFGLKVYDLNILQQFLADFNMNSLSDTDFEWAYQNCLGNDFEDALQLAVAIRSDCDKFITFDKNLYERYKNNKQIKVELAN